MSKTLDSRPVVVGIDGSKSAEQAAVWAAEEAVDTDSTLLLVHIVDPCRDDQEAAMAEARHVLRKAWDTVLRAGPSVKIESDVLRGDPALGLVGAARDARMICLGHKGVHDSASHRRGATAVQVVENASCTTVIVRRRRTPSPYRYQWILAALDESAESPAVFDAALNEAMLREAAVLALTSWSTVERHHPDPKAKDLQATLDRFLNDGDCDEAEVLVRAIPMPKHIFHLLEQSASIDQLVVVGANNHDVTRELLSRQADKILRKSNCSVMVVRGGADR
jgi:nucleotide-binding universal stress UspA family protein